MGRIGSPTGFPVPRVRETGRCSATPRARTGQTNRAREPGAFAGGSAPHPWESARTVVLRRRIGLLFLIRLQVLVPPGHNLAMVVVHLVDGRRRHAMAAVRVGVGLLRI